MRLPYFSRTQTGIILLLSAVLLMLYAWRANFFLAPSPPPAARLDLAFVEVTGNVPHPGVYSFPQPPTPAAAVQRAGGQAPAGEDARQIASGSRLQVAPGGSYQISRMSGAQLLTFGLPLNLNEATAEDLEALPGIGPALARRIVAYRQSRGPFQRVEDLGQVSGIGAQNLEKFKAHLVLATGEPPATAPEPREAGAAGKAGNVGAPANQGKEAKSDFKGHLGPKKAPAGAIDPNLASAKDLETLPGIGPALAQRIVAYRASHGPFKKIGDLEQVSGIGPKKCQKLIPYIKISQ